MIELLNRDIEKKIRFLRSIQNPDSGIPAYFLKDVSGIWCTGEVLFCLLDNGLISEEDPFPKSLASFLLDQQREDGGWSYRKKGLSFTDPTCWAILGISFYPQYFEKVEKGLEYLLSTQFTDEPKEDGWGIQAGERDRTYSTAIVVYTFCRLLSWTKFSIRESIRQKLETAKSSGTAHLLSTRNTDGGWGASRGDPSNIASTAHVLVSLFSGGANPAEFKECIPFFKKFIRSDGCFDSVDEVISLKMGLEVTMQWFSHPDCLKVFLGFAKEKLLEFPIVVNIIEGLYSFGTLEFSECVAFKKELSNNDYVWTIPHYLDGIAKSLLFLKKHNKEYENFRKQKLQDQEDRKRKDLYQRIQQHFPYPIVETFIGLLRETDSLTRFRRMLITVETIVSFLSSIAITGYLYSAEKSPEISNDIAEKLTKPSLGDWKRFLERIAGGNFESRAGAILSILKTILNRRIFFHEDNNVRNVSSGLSAFINLRNEFWGHGGIISPSEYKKLNVKWVPLLESILDELRDLEKTNLFFVFESEFDEFEGKELYTITSCHGLQFGDARKKIESSMRLSKGSSEPEFKYLYFQDNSTGTTVNLYPLWLMCYCEECKRDRFFTFQGSNRNELSYISYECGHHISLNNHRHLEILIERLTKTNEQP